MQKIRPVRLSRDNVVYALSVAVLGAGLMVVVQAAAGAAPVVVLHGGRVAVPTLPVDPKPPVESVQQGGDRDPGSIMDHAAESGAQVFVDDSFASVEKMRNAIRQASQGQSQLAINNFQDIITNYGQKLVYLNDKSYVSITDYVHEKLLQMPAVRQGMYDQLFGGEAKKAINAAIQRRDVATLIRVCDKFFPSSAALAGLSQAAEWYFERGEFSAASRTWQELLSHPLAGKMQGELLFRAAVAEALAHNGEAARKLRDRLDKDYPGLTGMVSGQDVKFISKLDDIIAMPAWDPVDLSREEWPAFGGGPARTKLLAVDATIGARLWSLTFGDESVQGSSENLTQQEQMLRARLAQVQAQARARGQTIDADGGSLGSFPVLSNGSLFIHTGDRIKSVSANAGTELWSYPQQPIPRMDAATELTLRNNLGLAVRLASHDSVAVFEDKVLAVMPAARNARAYDGSGIPLPSTRVVCINRDDGKEIWSRSADEIKVDSPGSLWFVGSPTVTRQGVFIMARKASNGAFAQQYLVRLDRESGNVTWSCYICSTSNGANYGNSALSMSSIAVPAIVDDIVYVASGQGADCAIDANVGRILWLRITDSGPTQRAPGQLYNPPISYTAPWKNNPPIIVGDKMVVCDTGQSLRIYNRWDGKLLKTLSNADFDSTFKIELLEGAVGSHVIVSGNMRTLSFDLDQVTAKTSKPVAPDWWVDVPAQEAGKPQGRPFLTADFCYIPYDRKLVRIALTSGKSESWDWPRTEKDTPGKPGNLLVTSEQVIVVNDNEVAGYSKWETARDNRLAKIQAEPANPEPYLSLAEISFRTSHSDLATEYMKKSIDLANAGEASAGSSGKPMADILRRLYHTNLSFAEQLLGKNDPVLRDQSRFYYEQCSASARDPEQQSEWRLRLAELSLKQKKYDEAASLYSAVLADPALRAAGYHDSDAIASAGAAAEQRLRRLISEQGPDLYRRFEDQAVGLLQKARAQHDLSALQRLVDSYPNSAASITAATELSAAYRDRQEWENARKVLWWLEPRVQGNAQARAIADLVTVCIGLKKYPSAAAWAARGMRQYKDVKLTNAKGEPITFESLRALVAGSGRPEIDGRLPAWNGESTRPPEMDGTPMDMANALAGTLLVPIETAPGLRPPNIMFLQRGDMLHILDAPKGTHVGRPILMPQNQPAVLLGTIDTSAILMQNNMIIGVDIRSHKVWTKRLPPAAGAPAVNIQRNGIQRINGRVLLNGNANGVVIINGNVMINGNQAAMQLDGQIIDPNTDLPLNRNILGMLAGDPDAMRRLAFQSLGTPNFTTARMLNGRLIVIAGNQMTAYNVATGEPAWKSGTGENSLPLTVKLPDGQPSSISGNEDVIVTQIDSPDGNSSSFFVVDADTGRYRKQFKLENEHANWRAVGDDGTLFVVSDKSVASYDLVGDQNKPIWLRAGIDTRYAAATALTLDGLIVVDNACDVRCLSLDSGEERWPAAPRLTIESATGAIAVLRSWVDDDQVIFQSDRGSTAVYSIFRETGQIAWKGSYPQGDTPSLQSLQISDAYLVELAQGSINNAQNAVRIIFRNRKGGKLARPERLVVGNNTFEGPQIRAWQILDGAIAIDVNGETHLWRNQPSEAPGR